MKLLVGCLAVLALVPAAASASRHYEGHVSGGVTGPGHSFFVGDGLKLVFRDFRGSGTAYKVCWTRGHGSHCWRRTTGAPGHASIINVAAPSGVGHYRTTWYVGGRAVAHWSFYNHIGD